MIRASVHDMQLTLGATVLLVMLVVFVFLRRLTPTIAVGVCGHVGPAKSAKVVA
jgi:multidrug efflux pump